MIIYGSKGTHLRTEALPGVACPTYDQPRAGDIYTVRSDSAGLYSLLKVRRVGGNNVELVANEYQIDNAAPIHSLNSPEKYSKEPFTLTRFELQIMRRKNQITDVDRP